MPCSVVDVKGRDIAEKAIETLHRFEQRGRFMIVREVQLAMSTYLTES